MTPEELKRFDEASNHPYGCKCAICKEWWAQVPPEDDEEEQPEEDYDEDGEDTPVSASPGDNCA